MKRYNNVVINGENIDNNDIKLINNLLKKNDLLWLIEADILNADIEVKNNTLIWNNGLFLSGDWHYGIFKNGSFYGTFKNGIIESGIFKGDVITSL